MNPLSLLTSALGGVWGYVAAAAVAGLLAAGGTGYVVHRMDATTLNQVKLDDAQAATKALTASLASQRRVDGLNEAAAVREAQAQQKIVTVTQTITRKVPVYVHDQVRCNSGLTVGLARILRAAAAGVDPASLSLPAGQSDDTCADLTPSEVASWFADYAAAARGNAEQLDALEAAVRANDKATQ